MELNQQKSIVFYDGSCGFCQASVQFVLKHNSRQNLHFAALQSEMATQLLAEARQAAPLPDAMLFYEGGRLYTASGAALRIARHLRFPFFLLGYGLVIPAFLRDFLYRMIARNRYHIAGRTAACLLPTPQQRSRFLA
ncbi:thiol-disulfide oxidoreductase DCC family protein [Pontibacter beigongshangensis]|uniref:thiol-disulfide oxidoreductase DCC family protein n=1 Tax=Pontibacter beigongshangensis TaxID=2574733 RepID=UPI00164FF8B8|nr:DCC1-like thiol-disulfide oxidoreductase family protein [Pontibacter beigongshangensis]